MMTITAPEKATQQHCERLRPRGLGGCIIQVRGNRHGLYFRASNMRSRYVQARPHTAMLYHTQHAFCL